MDDDNFDSPKIFTRFLVKIREIQLFQEAKSPHNHGFKTPQDREEIIKALIIRADQGLNLFDETDLTVYDVNEKSFNNDDDGCNWLVEDLRKI